MAYEDFSNKTRRNGNIALSAIFLTASMAMFGGPLNHVLAESNRGYYTSDAVEKNLDQQLKPQIAALTDAKAAPADQTFELHVTIKAADIRQAVDDRLKQDKSSDLEIGFIMAAGAFMFGRRAWRLNNELKNGPTPAP